MALELEMVSSAGRNLVIQALAVGSSQEDVNGQGSRETKSFQCGQKNRFFPRVPLSLSILRCIRLNDLLEPKSS